MITYSRTASVSAALNSWENATMPVADRAPLRTIADQAEASPGAVE